MNLNQFGGVLKLTKNVENNFDVEQPKISFQENFPFHYLAKLGDSYKMDDLFRINSEELFRLDFSGRTPLHYAVLCENLKDGVLCVKKILDFLPIAESEEKNRFVLNRFRTKRIRGRAWNADVGDKAKDYIDLKDFAGETALSLAAQNENPEIVQILLQKSADILSRNKKGKLALHFIYWNTPSALIAILNKSVTFDYGNSDDDLMSCERSERRYALDLTAIVGSYEQEDLKGERSLITDNLIESKLLYKVNNRKNVHNKKQILKHPLVQYFVGKKVQNFKVLSYLMVFFYLCWIGLYVWVTMDVYYACCDLPILEETQLYCSHFPFDFQHDDENDTIHATASQEQRDDARDAIYDCVDGKDRISRPIIVLFFTLMVIIKESFHIQILGRYYFTKLDNLLVWFFMCFIFVTIIPVSTIFVAQFQISAMGLLVGSMVILELVNKLIFWAIYIKVLVQVLKRFVAIIPLFFFIMFWCSLAFRMLFPDKFPSIENFTESIMLIFETVANGKVEWSSTFKESIERHFHLSGFIVFLGFYVMISLLLFRIIIGFVVADTKKIQEEEEINQFSADLEEIHLFESLLASKLSYLPKKFPFFWGEIQKRLLIFSSGSSRKLKLSEKEIPKHLRKDIRILASKNIVDRTPPAAKVKWPKLLDEIRKNKTKHLSLKEKD